MPKIPESLPEIPEAYTKNYRSIYYPGINN
jgi:hypothetical protein